MQAPINVQLTQPTLWTSGDLSSHFLAARLRHCCERPCWATLTYTIKVHIATYITNKRKHWFSIIFIRNHILLVKKSRRPMQARSWSSITLPSGNLYSHLYKQFQFYSPPFTPRPINKLYRRRTYILRSMFLRTRVFISIRKKIKNTGRC